MSLFANLFGLTRPVRRPAAARQRPASPAAPQQPVTKEPPPRTLSDGEVLRRLNALAATSLESGEFDKAEAERLASAVRDRWTADEFARAVRQAAQRQIALRRVAEREGKPLDPLAARAAAGYRASSSFNL